MPRVSHILQISNKNVPIYHPRNHIVPRPEEVEQMCEVYIVTGNPRPFGDGQTIGCHVDNHPIQAIVNAKRFKLWPAKCDGGTGFPILEPPRGLGTVKECLPKYRVGARGADELLGRWHDTTT